MSIPQGDDETLPASSSSASSDDGTTLPVGAHVGDRYQIVGFLGKGGMGRVYLAIDEALGKQKVALKVVPPELAGASAFDTIKREVLLAHHVTHRNVCRIYDLEEVDGEWMIKMEYVAGKTLAARLADGPLAIDEALAIARQIADGVGAAHARGVIHRDLKPGNVMIEDDSGRVVLMDFGVAREAAITGDTVPEVAGTPAYMSPEQVLAERVDARSDIYALGCVLYHMLVGEVPFPAKTAMAAGLRHVNDPPPDPRAERPEVPAWLASAVIAMLAKKPADRPQDVAAVLQLLAGPARRRRRLALALGAGTVLIGGAIAAYALTRSPWTARVELMRVYDNENSDGAFVSPDGTRIAYLSDREKKGMFRVHVMDKDGGNDHAISPAGHSFQDVRWIENGAALVAREHDVVRIPATGGEPSLLRAGKGWAVACGDGVLFAEFTPECQTCMRMVLRAGDGQEREVARLNPGAYALMPSCDRDGARAVFSYLDAPFSIYAPADLVVLDLHSNERHQLTHDRMRNLGAVFTPDGKHVVFTSSRGGRMNLWEMSLASGAARQLTTGDGADLFPSITPDGQRLLYQLDTTSAPLLARTATETQRVVDTHPLLYSLAASPDGKTVVAVDVVPFPRAVVAIDVATGSTRELGRGVEVDITRDGREAVFAGDGAPSHVEATPIAGGPTRSLGSFDGRVKRLAAGSDGKLHALVDHDGALQAWQMSLAGGRAEREAAEPWVMIVPAPVGDRALWIRPDGKGDFEGIIGSRSSPPSDDAPTISLDGPWLPFGFDVTGETLFYSDDHRIMKLELASGRRAPMYTAADLIGLAPSPDGTTLYTAELVGFARRAWITNFGDRPRP